MRTPAEHRKGIALMIGATLCWATAGVLVRNMEVTDGWKITFWRSSFMTAFLLIVLSFQHGSRILQRVRAMGWPGVVSGLLFAGMMICFILALSLTTVANTLVIGSISTFVAALCGRLFLGEKVAPRTWLAMIAAIGGITMMFYDALSSGGWAGNLIALCIPIGFGANVVVLRKYRATVDMVPSVLLAGIFSALIALPFALPLSVSAGDLALISMMGIVQLGVGLLLMMAAVRYLSSAEIGLLSILEIVFGTLSVWVIVGEHPSQAALSGGAVVIIALGANHVAGLRQPRSAAA
ncbi:MAG TPA: DMT family transporter [Burkholderiales bacterium]|jgi:drug/metabolite transporter (DMT)-like permease|nr:DMT family transporter [Burkholderiales bacterium]